MSVKNSGSIPLWSRGLGDVYKRQSLDEFVSTKLQEIIDPKDREAATQEFVFHVTHSLNVEFYAKDGRTDAFVLSHGRDLLILKIVGYAAVSYTHLTLPTICSV